MKSDEQMGTLNTSEVPLFLVTKTMENTPFKLTDDEKCKLRTYKNLVPAFRQKASDISNKIIALQGEKRHLDSEVESMTKYLEHYGEVPLTMAEWSKEMHR
jgi:hypothetical protein